MDGNILTSQFALPPDDPARAVFDHRLFPADHIDIGDDDSGVLLFRLPDGRLAAFVSVDGGYGGARGIVDEEKLRAFLDG